MTFPVICDYWKYYSINYHLNSDKLANKLFRFNDALKRTNSKERFTFK